MLGLIWIAIVIYFSQGLATIISYGGFLFLGVTGAIFANATGAGGGVVFVPFFNQLGMAPMNIVATSFAIQCCGMTAGAVTWWQYFRTVRHVKSPLRVQWEVMPNALLLTIPPSLCGIWMAQFGSGSIPALTLLKGNIDSLHLGFGIFSVLLSLAIFGSIPLLKREVFRSRMAALDIASLPVVAFLGGAITAWLSVGVGELIAVYLIIRGFNVTMAIATAVILTAFSVWGAIGYHLTVTQAVEGYIVMFAGAGAVIGGILAKRVVLAFSPGMLKLFFGAWVMVMGISGLPLY